MKKYVVMVLCCIMAIFLSSCDTVSEMNETTEPTKVKTYADYDKDEIVNLDELLEQLETTDSEGNIVINQDVANQLERVQGYTITINDFDIITDKETPLKTSKLNKERYLSLISTIDGMMYLSSRTFCLVDLTIYDEWIQFREFNSNGMNDDSQYYCVFEDEDEKAYLFFKPFYKTQTITKYIRINSYGEWKIMDDAGWRKETLPDWFSVVVSADR